MTLGRRLAAEGLGTMLLLATVVGSGIMAESLSGGNVAVALLGNTIPTGAILYVLIMSLGGVSGAHFNPAVTLVFAIRREIGLKDGMAYVFVQIVAAIAGVWLAHAMFDLDVVQTSVKVRSGSGQWISELVATFGLMFAILAALRAPGKPVAAAVGLYITAAYWFTASTSFANPAVTIARGFSDTFAGIRPADVPWFLVAQFTGAVTAHYLSSWLFLGNKQLEGQGAR